MARLQWMKYAVVLCLLGATWAFAHSTAVGTASDAPALLSKEHHRTCCELRQDPGFEDPHPRAKCVDRRRRTMMEHNTILYISDRANSSYSVFAALKETGCEVVSTNSPTQGVALLYIMRTVAGVVLDNRAREQASFDLAQSLSQLRPDVPIMLLSATRLRAHPHRQTGA
jgi:CheY-like chemotaxis protein